MSLTRLRTEYTPIKEILEKEIVDEELIVVGLITSARKQKLTDEKGDSKDFYFIHLQDKHIVPLQIIFDETEGKFEEYYPFMFKGASMKVRGFMVKSPAKGQAVEMKAREVLYFGKVEDPSTYPLSKKRQTVEELRQCLHLRARSKLIAALLSLNSSLTQEVHTFFRDNDFTYIDTPILTKNDCEGGGETFVASTIIGDKVSEIPTKKTEDGKDTDDIDFSSDMFGDRVYLSVSGQLNIEKYAVHRGNCYNFANFFRKEGSRSYKHLAEGRMIEPEMWFTTLSETIDCAEGLTKYLMARSFDRCPDEMELFNKFVNKGYGDLVRKWIGEPIVRVTYTEVVERLIEEEKSGVKFETSPHMGMDFGTEHEQYITIKLYDMRLVAITRWPKEIKPFYMLEDERDPRFVQNFDIISPYVGEIVGGSMREHNHSKLVSRMEEVGMNLDTLENYIHLRKCGTVPHGGFGLGFERLIMLVSGVKNIQDVKLLPIQKDFCPS